MEVEVLVAKHPIQQRSFYSNLYETGKVNKLSLFFCNFAYSMQNCRWLTNNFPLGNDDFAVA